MDHVNPYERRLEAKLKEAIQRTEAINASGSGDLVLENQVLIMRYLLWMRGGQQVSEP